MDTNTIAILSFWGVFVVGSMLYIRRLGAKAEEADRAVRTDDPK